MSKPPQHGASVVGPSFYAQPRFLRHPRLRDWWTVAHPPYTMLHLSLVTIGACLVAPVNAVRLVITLVAFFLAVGVGAHCLDELNGRPLKTSIPRWQLVAGSCAGLGGAIALGVVGMILVSDYLAVFIVVGVAVAVGYNLELFHGRLHNGTVLVLSWGAFPVLTAYFAQHETLSLAAFGAAAFGALVTQLQRQLSTPARELRRRTADVDGVVEHLDGTRTPITKQSLLRPLEGALRTLCWLGVALAATLAYLRLH